MAILQAETKRGILRSLWRSAQRSAVSLDEALAAFQDKGYDAIRTGRPVTSTSGAGYSVTYQLPGLSSEITQVQVFNLAEEFFAVLSTANATLATAGVTSPTDQQRFDTMMADDALQTVSLVQQDHMMTRWATR